MSLRQLMYKNMAVFFDGWFASLSFDIIKIAVSKCELFKEENAYGMRGK